MSERPVRRRARSSAEARPDQRRGLLVVYTGHGKGKTTAALGMVFRALGRGFRVSVVQFIKGKWKTGERMFAETLPALDFHVMGLGFTWESDDLGKDKAAARAAWDKAREEILSGERDLVVLDERPTRSRFTTTFSRSTGGPRTDVLRARPAHVHVVVTGRNAPEELVALADLVTEMAVVKHPFAARSRRRSGRGLLLIVAPPSPPLSIPRLVLAGISSGVGKTTVTVALARALRARGLRVALFKCGPDYLDPTYHTRAVDSPSQNLDGWMMGRDAVRATFARASTGADIALIEGVMGLFDGASPTGEEGSTAEIAKWLEAPVVLVIDAGGMARSFAAVVQGFAAFDPKVRLAGAIAREPRGESRGHLRSPAARAQVAADPRRASRAIEAHGFRRAPSSASSQRRRGASSRRRSLDHWGRPPPRSARSARRAARPSRARARADAGPFDAANAPPETRASGETRCRIGIARDAAFHFYYADNLRRLEALGAVLVPFSPIGDADLPDVDGLYIGGGYPEAHAAALSANTAMLASVRAFAHRGAAACRSTPSAAGSCISRRPSSPSTGARHPAGGPPPERSAHVREAPGARICRGRRRSRRRSSGGAGSRFRGHQFRYSELSPRRTPTPIDHVYSPPASARKPTRLREGLPRRKRARVVRARALGVEPARRRGVRRDVRALAQGGGRSDGAGDAGRRWSVARAVEVALRHERRRVRRPRRQSAPRAVAQAMTVTLSARAVG